MEYGSLMRRSGLCLVLLALVTLTLSHNLTYAQDTYQEDIDLDGRIDYRTTTDKIVVIPDISTDKDTGDIIHTVPAPGSRCQGLTYDGTNLWVSDYQTDLIYEVSTVDGAVISSFTTPGNYVEGLAWDGTNLWASDNGGGPSEPNKIYKLNPSDGTVIHSFTPHGAWPHGITYDGQYLWIDDFYTKMIYKVDPSDGQVLDSIPAPGDGSIGLTWDSQYLWSDDFLADKLYQIDPSDGSIIRMVRSPHTNPRDLAWDGQYIWVLSWQAATIFQIDVGGGISVEEGQVLPDDYVLYVNFPNPFNSSTTIRYEIRTSDVVQITIYDELGRLVRTLVNGEKQPGEYSVVWDGKNEKGVNVSGGFYIYRLSAGSFNKTRRMLLLK
ncbi:glutaminyl-peptide cyclotransferase [candidate division WOR-3 bacterium]|nr:glutaminyl-peptide cyclotransferase [candidate division WOR-3 bacterium]